MPRAAHPPLPGPIVQPNVQPVMEAIGAIAFPISKHELLEEVRGRTALLGGRNVDLRDILAQVHDDVFASDEELAGALEALLARPTEESEPEAPAEEAAPGPAGA